MPQPVFTSVTSEEYADYHAMQAHVESTMRFPSFGKKLQMRTVLEGLYDNLDSRHPYVGLDNDDNVYRIPKILLIKMDLLIGRKCDGRQSYTVIFPRAATVV